MRAEVVGSIMFLTALVGVPVAVAVWLGVGPGLLLGFIEMGVVGFLVGYDAYAERMKKGKPNA